MLPGNRFLFGLVSFLIAHVCYIFAFFPGAAAGGFPWAAVPLALIGAIILAYLWPALSAGLKAAVCLYVAVIVAMVSLAANRAISRVFLGYTFRRDRRLAVYGVRRYFGHRPLPQAVSPGTSRILGSLLFGQLMIALSIGLLASLNPPIRAQIQQVPKIVFCQTRCKDNRK